MLGLQIFYGQMHLHGSLHHQSDHQHKGCLVFRCVCTSTKGSWSLELGECSHPAKFLGYYEDSARYKVYDPITHKVAHSLIFHKTALPHPNTTFESPADDSDY